MNWLTDPNDYVYDDNGEIIVGNEMDDSPTQPVYEEE